VLLVHHEVAGVQLERVDLLLAPRRHASVLPGGSALPHQVVGGQDDQPLRRTDQPVSEAPRHDVHDVGLQVDIGQLVVGAGGEVVLGKHLDGAGDLARPRSHHHNAMTLGQPVAYVGDSPLGVAAVGADRRDADRPGVDRAGLHIDVNLDRLTRFGAQRRTAGELIGVGIGGERGGAPPAEPATEAVPAYVGERAVGGGAQVDRRLATSGGSRPRRREELLAGGHQVVRARRTRSGSHTSTVASTGSRSTSISMSSTRTGARDSMPSTAWPSASLSNSSASCGCCSPAGGLGAAPRR
jgi:hypothetical protein